MRCAVPDPIIVLAVDVADDGAPPLRLWDGEDDGIVDPPPHGEESTDSAMSRSAIKDLRQPRPLTRGPSKTILWPLIFPITSTPSPHARQRWDGNFPPLS